MREAAEAARAAPAAPGPPRPVDVVLDAVALGFIEGYATAAPALTHAFRLLLALDAGPDEGRRWLSLVGGPVGGSLIAMQLWDFESGHALAIRRVKVARDMGALVHLQFALSALGMLHLHAGELSVTERLIDEDRLIAEAAGNPPYMTTAMMLAAWQGREEKASKLIQAALRDATGSGTGRLAVAAAGASAVLDNGLGRYNAARDTAWEAFQRDHLALGQLLVAELAEAAARTGDVALVRAALEWLSERTRVLPTQWALGIEARIRALLGEGDAAESCYRELFRAPMT